MPTKEEREKEKRRKKLLEEQGKKGGVPTSRGLNIQHRLEIERAKAGREGQLEMPIRAGERVILPSRLEAEQMEAEKRLKKEGEEARRREFQEATESDILKAELEEKIMAPPSLEPEPIGETVGKGITKIAEVGLIPSEAISERISVATGLTREFEDTEEFAKTGLGKVIGLTTAAIGGIVIGATAAPFVVKSAASAIAAKGVLGTGGSATLIKAGIAGTAIFLVGRSVFDIRGDEMDVLRAGMKKVVEDGERIEAATRNGLPTGDTIKLLRTMADETAAAEQRIKELGVTNLNYRVSKEWILDQQNARSAREAILRRVLAVENIAATGQAAYDPGELLYNVQQI